MPPMFAPSTQTHAESSIYSSSLPSLVSSSSFGAVSSPLRYAGTRHMTNFDPLSSRTISLPPPPSSSSSSSSSLSTSPSLLSSSQSSSSLMQYARSSYRSTTGGTFAVDVDFDAVPDLNHASALSALHALRREHRELIAELARMKATWTARESEFLSQRAELQQTRIELRRLRAETTGEVAEHIATVTKARAVEEEKRRAELANAIEDRDAAYAQLTALKKAVSDAEDASVRMTMSHATMERALTAIKTKNETLTQRTAQLQRQTMEQEIQLEAAAKERQRLVVLMEALAGVEVQNQTLTQRVAQLTKENNKLVARVRSLEQAREVDKHMRDAGLGLILPSSTTSMSTSSSSSAPSSSARHAHTASTSSTSYSSSSSSSQQSMAAAAAAALAESTPLSMSHLRFHVESNNTT